MAEPGVRQLVNLATEAFQASNYDEAERLLLDVIARRPVYANVYNMLGFIYTWKNAPEKAVELFRRALTLNPNYTEAQINLAITLAEMGAADLASLEVGKAQEREEQQPAALASGVRVRLANAHADLGRTYQDLALHEQAVAEYDKALSLCPNFADLHLRRGISCREKGDYAEAGRSFRQALTINPNYVDAHVNLGSLYWKVGNGPAAEKAWRRALELDPKNHLARIYLRQWRAEAGGQPAAAGPPGDGPAAGGGPPGAT